MSSIRATIIFISEGATSLNPTITAPGTYELLITNEDNGCTANDFVEISQDNNAPIVDACLLYTSDAADE